MCETELKKAVASGFVSTLAGLGVTIGDQIEATAKDIGSDTAKSVMKELVGQALGWIVRGVTGL